jgi:hypothetical protein
MAAAAQVGVEVDVVVDAVVGAVTGSGSVVVLVSEPPPPQAVKIVKHTAVNAVVKVLDFRIAIVVSVLFKSKKSKKKKLKNSTFMACYKRPAMCGVFGRQKQPLALMRFLTLG